MFTSNFISIFVFLGLDSLCDLLPGELCAHICVPIPGSFRCECREGFTLMADGKSCQHDDLPNRYYRS